MNAWYLSNLTLIQATLVNIVLATSFQVVLRSGVFSLASVGFFGLGAYLGANLALDYEIPGLVIVGICLIGALLLARIFALALIRLRGLYLGMVTIAFVLILGVFAVNAGSFTGGAVGLFGIPPLLTTAQLLGVVVIVLVLLSQLERRGIGRSFEVLRSNEELALSVGLNVRKLQTFVIVLSSGLGAIAGVMYVFVFSTVNPRTAGFGLVILGLSMAVVGGRRSWVGAVIGALLLTWLPDILSIVGPWRAATSGVILMAIMVFAPDGILGLLRGIPTWVLRRTRVQADVS